MSEKSRVHIVSLGCAKNQVDSEIILGATLASGHQIVSDPGQADVVVVNTCGFIEDAKRESIDTILELARYKEQGALKKLIVTGCLTQRYPQEVADEIPEIDKIFGSGEVDKVAREIGVDGKDQARIDVADEPHFLYNARSVRELSGPTHTAYVKIAEGCDRPCAFCIIPKLRGKQRSRSIEDIVAETTNLAALGVREINLIAQDLTKYGDDLGDKPTLAKLLQKVARVDGVRWVRLHYTYPSAFTDELIEVIASEPNVANYIDVPVQHIDSGVLKAMRRGYGERAVHDLFERLRRSVDNVVLRTTLIAGHPGEDEAAFRKLRDFVAEAKIDHLGVFLYSQEEGTPAAEITAPPREVAEERRNELLAMQKQWSHERLQAMVGNQLEVLVDGVSDESEYLLQGRWYGQAQGVDGCVYLTDGQARAGDFVNAKVIDSADYDLAASIVEINQPSQGRGRRLPVVAG